MIYLAIGAAALALLVWLSRGRPILQRGEWRLLSAAFALAAFTGAAWVAMRGAWGSAVVLTVVGLWLLASSRREGLGPGKPTERMSEADARSILGVSEAATREEILSAYNRLIRRAHPDAGGSAGLAAQLNAARDRLLRK